MNSNVDKRLDFYEVSFGRGESAELLNEVEAMEANSNWEEGVRSASLSVEAVDGPLFAKEAADKYGLDYDLTLDTADVGTKLILNINNDRHELLRDTAKKTLLNTAKIFGSALENMSPYLFAETVNNALSVARGSTLLLMRYGKASALHSNADGGYDPMLISELIKSTEGMIEKRFKIADFLEGYTSHSYTCAKWALPHEQKKILEMYRTALNGTTTYYPLNYMPALIFRSSDTQMSSAILEPVFYVPTTDVPVRFVEGVNIKHLKRSGGSSLAKFKAGIETVYAKFEASAKVIERLATIEVQNGTNAVVSLCNKYGIAKKYGDAARIRVERLTAATSCITAHDIYISMTEAIAEAIRAKASSKTVMDLEEKITKILYADWSEHDVTGLVAWGQKAQ